MREECNTKKLREELQYFNIIKIIESKIKNRDENNANSEKSEDGETSN
jgi:hypothetical protein